jgi:hypothetical protein
MTATVETVSEQLDLANIIQAEKIIPTNIDTISETDIGKLDILCTM